MRVGTPASARASVVGQQGETASFVPQGPSPSRPHRQIRADTDPYLSTHASFRWAPRPERGQAAPVMTRRAMTTGRHPPQPCVKSPTLSTCSCFGAGMHRFNWVCKTCVKHLLWINNMTLSTMTMAGDRPSWHGPCFPSYCFSAGGRGTTQRLGRRAHRRRGALHVGRTPRGVRTGQEGKERRGRWCGGACCSGGQ